MSLVINHNMMAANAARTLNTHYGNLATSTQRLSSGLRINSAADDAAGLAIRELMRADVAALHQGVRNANDAISMIQVVDGALGVIDEKLIRMKELAEQAATGTYDSTQRLMIDSEFQAMASEIQRIAVATDFNGIKLIDGTRQLSPPPMLGETIKKDIYSRNILNYENVASGSGGTNWERGDQLVEIVEGEKIEQYYIKDNMIYKDTINDLKISLVWETNEWRTSVQEWHFAGNPACNPSDVEIDCWDGGGNGFKMLANEDQTIPNYFLNKIIDQRYGYANNRHYYYFDIDINDDTKWNMTYIVSLPIFEDIDDVKNNIIIDKINVDIIELDKFLVSTREDKSIITEEIGDIDQLKSEKIMIHFGPMNDSAEDYYNIEKRDCTLKGLGLEDVRIETQDNAQKSLVTINDAIVKKDQARAYYGAMQIRLENTVSNLTIQAENLQASESRISDVDVATEMTNFVRNQILTQSAVAMLSQANSMPQMAMQLIGG